MKSNTEFMRIAISLAKSASSQGEVPVGAVIVSGDRIVGVGANSRERDRQACRHAEIMAIERACQNLDRWRLKDCRIFVTLEPCLMCAGAIWQSRISEVVFGARDPKGGAFGSLYKIHEDNRLNHQPDSVIEGVLKEESANLLKEFFRSRR